MRVQETPKGNPMKTQLKATAAGVVLVATTATLVQTSAEGSVHATGSEAAMSASNSLEGVWAVTVDPLPNPGGNQPPFESTLAFDASHVLNEITSRLTSTSAGLGAWEKVGDSTYRTQWLKYRFDGTGAYIGKTVITEDITVIGKRRYSGRARTQVIDASGAVVAQFEPEVAAERLTP